MVSLKCTSILTKNMQKHTGWIIEAHKNNSVSFPSAMPSAKEILSTLMVCKHMTQCSLEQTRHFATACHSFLFLVSRNGICCIHAPDIEAMNFKWESAPVHLFLPLLPFISSTQSKCPLNKKMKMNRCQKVKCLSRFDCNNNNKKTMLNQAAFHFFPLNTRFIPVLNTSTQYQYHLHTQETRIFRWQMDM